MSRNKRRNKPIKINDKIIRGITKYGFRFSVDSEVFKDMEMLELIGEVDDNPILMPKLLEKMFGKKQKDNLYDFVRDDKGSVPIEKISEMYGDYLGEDENRKYYSFPSPDQLALAKPEDLREFARVGFRDKRIVEASKLIASGQVDISKIQDMELEDARKELQILPGVGPKVADCILLFAFDRKESFPVDVWIKRVMEELYLKEVTPKSKIAMRGREVFGKNAGFANQYLFYYGRENKLGK